ncbi:MAG: hypothetical protein OIN87_10135 [Candidatus Methanoperedens sp.]|nr:hypothetical protein [Candidatus Methanoperedens sp.]
MKKILMFILLSALVLPASASNVVSWIQTDISGYNLTLNYTSNFSVAKDDTLGIIINNIGNESINDSITVNKINVSENSIASGNWTGSLLIRPNSSETIDFILNMKTNNESSIHINIYYNISSDNSANKMLVVQAHFAGAPVITSWYPQIVDYVEVNGTLNETIEYSITTVESMSTYNWSVDGQPVLGDDDGNTYFYTHTWNNSSLGVHTVNFKGNNSDSRVEFRWYVNVYREGAYSGGNLFDLIDESLENHVTDLKIRIFKYKIAKDNGKSDYAARKVNQLHDEIAKRQMTRQALRTEFKAGNITVEEYVAAMKQVQRDAKYNSKLAKGYANIAKDIKDNESEKEFKKISEIERQEDRKISDKKNDEKKTNNVKNDIEKINNAKNIDKKSIGNMEEPNDKSVKNNNNGQKNKGNGKN